MDAFRTRTLLGDWAVEDLVITDFFGYYPSTALAAVALALFVIGAAVVAFQTERSRWRFMHTVSITGLLEAGGYAALLFAIQRSGEGNIYGSYVTMQVFVILSPNLLQATDYWAVGNLLAASPDLTRGKRWLARGPMTAIFAGADLFALIIQAIGISIWATAKSSDGSPEDVKLGSEIMLAGLAFQLFCFGLFTVLAIWVHRHPKNAINGTCKLRKLYTGLYINITFLFVRNIYRFAEFTQETVLGWPPPPDTYILADKQVLFYTLDTLPILLCFAAFIVYHPGWYLPLPPAKEQPHGEASGQSSEAESMEAGKLGAVDKH